MLQARRLQLEELRFLYDGIRLNPDQTVAGATDQSGKTNLEIGNGAVLDCMVETLGG
jgi:hypothetical protein